MATVSNKKSSSGGSTIKGNSNFDPKKWGGSGSATNTTIDKDKSNFWIRTADNKTITLDVYGLDGSKSTLNSGSDILGGGFSNTFDIKIASALGQAGGILGKLKTAVGIAAKAKAIYEGKGDILDKLKNVGGLTQTVLTGLNIPKGSDLYNKIVAGTNIIVKGADTVRKIKNTDWGNIQSVSKLVSEYTKDNDLFKVSDLGAEAAFCATLVNECVKNGFPDSFEKIANVVGNSTVIKNALGDILPITMSMSDLDNLGSIVKFVGGPEMRSLFPGLSESFTSMYKRSFFDDSNDSNRFLKYHGVMDNYDTDWYLTYRGQEKILSVEKIIVGSQEFKDMYRVGSQTNFGGNNDKTLLILSTVFGKTTVMNELKRNFPNTLVKVNTMKVNRGNEDLVVRR